MRTTTKTLRIMLFQVAQLVSFGAMAQQPAATGSLEGIVVESGTGKLLPKTSLELRSMDNPMQRSPNLSGDGGRFLIRNLSAGRYALIASHTGYMHAEYGQRGPNGKGLTITLAAGQKLTGIRLIMTPSGAISGHTYGANGSPSAYVQVQARRISFPSGQRTLTVTSSTVTDDRGAYRLYGLPPGQYIVSAQTNPPSLGIMPVLTSATPPVPGVTVFQSAAGPMQYDQDPANQNKRTNESVLTYFPSATDDRDARVVDVRPGDDVTGINMAISGVSVRPVMVSGAISGDVTPNSSVSVSIGLPSGAVQSRLSAQRGAFTVSVPPGSYVAVATGRGSTGAVAGYADLDVRPGISPVVGINVTPTLAVSGRVVVEGRPASSNDPDLARLRVSLRRNPQLPAVTTVSALAPRADGSFVIRGLLDGDYELAITGAVEAAPRNALVRLTASFVQSQRESAAPTLPESLRNAYIKSVRATNAEFVNNRMRIPVQPTGPIEIEIVLGLRGGQLAGVARNAAGEAQANVTAVLVPDQQDRAELYKNVVTDAEGRFRFEGIAPGSYRLYCWEDVQTDDWRNPAFVNAIQDRGKSVRVDEGSRGNTDIVMIPIRG